MNIFSLICNTPIIALIFLLEMGFAKHKLKAIIHLSFFLLGFHIIAILKQAYQQSRPVWVSNQINKWQWFCPTDFGNQSGHSYVAFPLFEPIISKYIGFQKLKVAWGFVILFGVVVPFSRTYLGVHSLNQIFFGLSFGMAWIVLYRYGLRQIFYQIFAKMLKKKNPIHLTGIIIVHIVLSVIPIIIFSVRSNNTPLYQGDLINLNRICDSNINSVDIQFSMFALCIFHSVCFGLMYGFFALKYTKQSKLYFSGQWRYKDNLSIILHCIAQLLCAATVPVSIIIGFGSFWKQPYTRYFGFNISLIIKTIMYIWLTQRFERKYGWIIYEQQDKVTHQGGFDRGIIHVKTGNHLVDKSIQQ